MEFIWNVKCNTETKEEQKKKKWTNERINNNSLNQLRHEFFILRMQCIYIWFGDFRLVKALHPTHTGMYMHCVICFHQFRFEFMFLSLSLSLSLFCKRSWSHFISHFQSPLIFEFKRIICIVLVVICSFDEIYQFRLAIVHTTTNSSHSLVDEMNFHQKVHQT